MARRDKPLYRDTADKMLGGVCSGLGQYFDVDTTLVRVGFVVLALIGGGGVLLYLLLWLLLEPAPLPAPAEPSGETEQSVPPMQPTAVLEAEAEPAPDIDLKPDLDAEPDSDLVAEEDSTPASDEL